MTYTGCRFILKYQDGSRDTIALLKQGVGGVSEARKVVEAYEEKSPLYGLVQYRRRKILLKYVPDGTSRVLQGLNPSIPESLPAHKAAAVAESH